MEVSTDFRGSGRTFRAGAARRRPGDAVQRVGTADLIHADTFSAAAFTVVLLSVKMLRSGVVRPYTASVRRRGGVRQGVEFCGLPRLS